MGDVRVERKYEKQSAMDIGAEKSMANVASVGGVELRNMREETVKLKATVSREHRL